MITYLIRPFHDQLARTFRERGAVRGEITVVVEGRRGSPAAREAADAGDVGVDERIREALAAGSAVKALSREIARRTGLSPREVYARAIALRAREPGRKKP